jgi:nuclear GTP-binding protein
MPKSKSGGSRLPAFSKGNSSSNPDRVVDKSANRVKANKSGGSLRDKATIKRLKLYTGGKVKRDKKGVVIEGDLARRDRAGNAEITGATGRVQPDRRWFGNTRTIKPEELDKFRHEMREARRDPFSVVLHRKRVPTSLVAEPSDERPAKAKREELLAAQPFERSGTSRKRVKQPSSVDASENPLAALAKRAKKATDDYDAKYEGGADTRALASEQAEALKREGKDCTGQDLFAKGQSKRIWAELYKVLDCSDIVIHVVDARDPPGTTCTRVVSHLKTQATHKHLVFVLNKCDLVPNWCVRRWISVLGETAPTLAFRASTTKPFGKGALIDVLRQFSHLKSENKQISCGVVGYPNVGKSSVINSLRAKDVCKTAPVPGETKIWQYVALTRRVNLIDSPGVVYNDEGGADGDANAVLKGVVRAERLPDPEVFIAPLLRRCNPKHIVRTYDVPFDGLPGNSEADEAVAMDFLDTLARKSGRLRKGGEADIHTVAVQMLNDWQRGKMPHFVAPPEDPNRPPREGAAPDWADEKPAPKKGKGKARASATN